MIDDSYQKFRYGFIMDGPNDNHSYHVREDRVLYDWMVEPLPEELANSKKVITRVDLPEGYFTIGIKLFDPQFRDWSGSDITQQSNVNRSIQIVRIDPISSKAGMIAMGTTGISKAEFDAYEIPEYRIFRL